MREITRKFGKKNCEQETTQVGRALQELGANAILGSTPRGKGKIQRLWGTLQDRLVAELRLHGIIRMPRANEFINNESLASYNERFSVQPGEAKTAFKPLPEGKDLRSVFCIKEKRKVSQAQTFSYGGEVHLVDKTRDYRFRTADILLHDDGQTDFEIYGKRVSVTKMNKSRNEVLMAAARDMNLI